MKNKVYKNIVIGIFLVMLLGNIIIVADPFDDGPLVPGGDYAYDTIPLPATNVESTTATLNGWYGWGGTDTSLCGFLYSDTFPIATTNVTVGYFTNSSVSKFVSGLTPSTCYYFTIWCMNDTFGFFKSYLNESFLTKPSGPPANFIVTDVGAGNVTLTWDNVTDYTVTDIYQETIVRYSNTHQPNEPTDGTLGYQGIAETCTVTGLNSDSQYYFSAWTHITDNCSWNGSYCLCHQNSSEFATTSAYTQGGEYNLTIRYENRTYGPVNLTRWGPHKLIIYYYGQNFSEHYGEVDYVIFNNNGTRFIDMEAITNPSVNCTIDLTYDVISVWGVYLYNDSTGYWEEVSDIYYDINSTRCNISSDVIFDNHTFGRIEYMTIDTFTVEHDPMAFFDNNASNFSLGKINVNVNKTIKYFKFHWNDSTENLYRCNRIIATEFEQRDYDIFIRTDLPVYLEGTITRNHSLVKYIYSFIDETGKFKLTNHPKAYIYTYDDEENKLIIHSEWFDDELHISPWLVYEKYYEIGVKCDVLEYEKIGISPAGDNQQPEVRIPYEYEENYQFYDIFNITTGWFDSGFWVLYQDTRYSTVEAVFNVYGFYNKTLIYTNSTTNSYKNFSYECNISGNYLWEITATIDDVVNEYDGTYTSGKIPAFGSIEPIIDEGTINDILEIILGPSPMFYDSNMTGGDPSREEDVVVPWTYIAIFSVCFVWLTTFGRLNASVGGLGVGAILSFSGAAISGMSILYSNYSWWEGPILLVIGVFVMVISFLGMMGGVER